MQLFALCAAKPALARLDILLDLRRHGDPRIVPFLLRVLQDSDGTVQMRDLVQSRTSLPG